MTLVKLTELAILIILAMGFPLLLIHKVPDLGAQLGVFLLFCFFLVASG